MLDEGKDVGNWANGCRWVSTSAGVFAGHSDLFGTVLS